MHNGNKNKLYVEVNIVVFFRNTSVKKNTPSDTVKITNFLFFQGYGN